MDNYLAQINLGDEFLGDGHFLTEQGGVGKLVRVLVSNSIILAGVVLIIAIIYSGYTMITASGDERQFAQARVVLTSAIIGFVIVVAAWFIVKWIETATGVNIFST